MDFIRLDGSARCCPSTDTSGVLQAARYAATRINRLKGRGGRNTPSRNGTGTLRSGCSARYASIRSDVQIAVSTKANAATTGTVRETPELVPVDGASHGSATTSRSGNGGERPGSRRADSPVVNEPRVLTAGPALIQSPSGQAGMNPADADCAHTVSSNTKATPATLFVSGAMHPENVKTRRAVKSTHLPRIDIRIQLNERSRVRILQ